MRAPPAESLEAGDDVETEQLLVASFDGRLARVAPERGPAASPEAVCGQLGVIPPALRHTNDLEAIVSAMPARPDWVISATYVNGRAHTAWC